MKALYGFLLVFASTWTILVTKDIYTNINILQVCHANMQFARDLLDTYKDQTNNFVVSPFSIHVLLSMLLPGAKGNTADALENALLLTSEVAVSGYESVILRLNYAPNITLNLSNNIYLMEGTMLLENFNLALAKGFLSAVKFVAFSDNIEAAEIINAWVKSQTHNNIWEVVSPGEFNTDTHLALINGIYFKNDWKEKFDKNLSKQDHFYVTPSEDTIVEMMQIETMFNTKHFDDLEATIVEVPYANKFTKFYILLPDEKDGLRTLEEKLSNFDLKELFRGLNKTPLILKMPKFKINLKIYFEDFLKKMGFGIIFDKNEADFSGISTDNKLFINKVTQRVWMEVDEEGAEAAGSNGLNGGKRIPPAGQIEANHPFLFWVISSLTYQDDGSIIPLFSGKITMDQ